MAAAFFELPYWGQALALGAGGGLVLGAIWQLSSWLIFNRDPRDYRLGAVRRGEKGVVVEWSPDQGRGRIDLAGETWTAECRRPLSPGDHVRVTSVDGLKLNVSAARRK
ncbi:MAG: NfeD family protein [Pseudomonadota bacterium]